MKQLLVYYALFSLLLGGWARAIIDADKTQGGSILVMGMATFAAGAGVAYFRWAKR